MSVNNLKTIRLKRCMTVSELAAKSGVSRQTIYDIENGTRKNVQTSTLARLTDAMNCKLDDIFIFFL